MVLYGTNFVPLAEELWAADLGILTLFTHMTHNFTGWQGEVHI